MNFNIYRIYLNTISTYIIQSTMFSLRPLYGSFIKHCIYGIYGIQLWLHYLKIFRERFNIQQKLNTIYNHRYFRNIIKKCINVILYGIIFCCLCVTIFIIWYTVDIIYMDHSLLCLFILMEVLI